MNDGQSKPGKVYLVGAGPGRRLCTNRGEQVDRPVMKFKR